MSMDIGGVDLPLTDVPRAAYDPRLILAVIAECWPESVFEGVADEATRPVAAILEGDERVTSDDFFVYRNHASAVDWQRNGATARNGNDMLHFLASEKRRGGPVATTMVIGDITPEMGRLYWAIDNALAHARAGRRRSRLSRHRVATEAELQAAGSTLTARALADLAYTVLGALYPEWTVDELACHPHDALQFCAAVRSKAGAPIPDHLIMRVLLNRQQRAIPQPP
jgi:hypothetical protein